MEKDLPPRYAGTASPGGAFIDEAPSRLDKFDNFLKNHSTANYDPNFVNVFEKRKRRRLRRGEPRKSVRGNITRFGSHGRVISVTIDKIVNGKPRFKWLHATKGWRYSDVLPPGWHVERG